MCNDKHKALGQKYSDILMRSPWTGEPTDYPHLAVENGWLDIIDRLCAGIEAEFAKHPELRGKVYAVQVKEKFGGLRFYLSCETDEIRKLVRAAEKESYMTCETCGQPGKHRPDLSWILTLCDEHYDNGGNKTPSSGN